MNKKVKHFVTKITPPMRLEVSGPCSFDIRPMNESGEYEISFELSDNIYVEKYKLKHDGDVLNVSRTQSKPRRVF